MTPKVAIKFLLVAILLFSSSIRAQQSVMESEPNERPAESLEVAGEVTLIGSMAGNDQAERRDELRAYLLTKGIETLLYYGTPLHLHTAASSLGYQRGRLSHG
jgi:hypothetical protein